MAAVDAPAPCTVAHWTIKSCLGVSRELLTYKVSRDDLPDTGQVDLQMEHLVWAGALSPRDRIKMVGSNRADEVYTIEEIPPNDTWQNTGNEKIYIRSGDIERISRKEIEQEGNRGLDGWLVDLRDEGWTPLTMVTQRLIHYHAIIDSWQAQKQSSGKSS